MRCKKCAYITYDFYNECPKCGNSFVETKKKLNIIDYSIEDDCNYLIPEVQPEIQKEVNITDDEEKNIEIKTEEVLKQTEIEEPQIEHTKVEEEKEESHVEEDGISISELLETTKLED